MKPVISFRDFAGTPSPGVGIDRSKSQIDNAGQTGHGTPKNIASGIPHHVPDAAIGDPIIGDIQSRSGTPKSRIFGGIIRVFIFKL